MSVLSKGGDGTTPSVTLESVMAEVTKLVDAKLGGKFDEFKKVGLGDAIKSQVDPISAQLVTINEALGKLLIGGQPGTGTGGGAGDGGGGGKGQTSPEVNAQLRSLTETVKNQGATISQLQKDKETAERRAEETDRHSNIKGAIASLQFVNDKAATTAFSIVAPHVRRLDDGALVAGNGGENLPVDVFAKDFLEKEHGYLFRSTGASGSGAPPGTGGVRVGTKVDTSIIKVGMKADDRQAVVDSIAAVLQAQ